MLRTPAVLLLSFLLPALTACSDPSVADSNGGRANDASRVEVVAGFYPLQWVAEQVTGARAEVTSLTRPGGEPHDLELGPREVARIGKADLVVYLGGFQPAVDQAVQQEAKDAAYDVAASARLDLTHDPRGEHADDHADEEQSDPPTGEGRDARDPHFWLDPLRLADVADGVAQQLSRIDTAHATEYAQGAATARRQLEALDDEMRRGLASCAGTPLVTSHTAFGYLAERYQLTQVGITGLTPDADPAAEDLADVAAFVKRNRVKTIYYETLVSPDVAKTVARETGAATAVLDPIEGLTDQSAGRDYLAVMRSNLATLQDGQPCR